MGSITWGQELAEVYDSLGPERKGFLAIFEANDI